MFLAIREIRQSPTRFVLISSIILLVSYLVYFLAGLAYGLATSYSGVIDSWKVSTVAVSDTANKNMLTSKITQSSADAVTDKHDATEFFVRASVLETPEHLRKNDVEDAEATTASFLFGVKKDSPALPEVVEGSFPVNDSEILASGVLKAKGYTIGETIHLVDSDTNWTISGFTTAQSYQTSPVFFIPYEVYASTFDYSLKTRDDVVAAQAILFFDELSDEELQAFEDHQLTALTLLELKQALPGYQAQILTFSFMIAALIGIVAFVLGIFIYVLTLQKRSIFGIMKAQGIPTSYILISGAVQTVILTFFGVGSGLGLAVLSGYLLSNVLPFLIDPLLYGGVTAAFFLFTLFGALAPIRTISRIDPLEAIG